MAKMENTFLWEKATGGGDATFKSGEKVSEVDYLDVINQQQINAVQGDIDVVHQEVSINTKNIRDLTAQVLECTKVDSFYKITRIITMNGGDSYVVLVPNIKSIIVPGYNYRAMRSNDSNVYYLPVSVKSIGMDVGGVISSLGGAQLGIVQNATGGKDFVIVNIAESDQTVCVSYLCSDKNG